MEWQTADEGGVRTGQCRFPVKDRGLAEVDESREMRIGEDAVERLKAERQFSQGFFGKTGKKAGKAVLWASASGLRVVDEKTKDLTVEQTTETVSSCAPQRTFDRAVSDISRDGTTGRWICHCFLAVKDTGEGLSHAVGSAFAACLGQKQTQEKEYRVTATFDASDEGRVIPCHSHHRANSKRGESETNPRCQEVPGVGGEAESISSPRSQTPGPPEVLPSALRTKPVTGVASQSPDIHDDDTDSAFRGPAAKPDLTALAPTAVPVRKPTLVPRPPTLRTRQRQPHIRGRSAVGLLALHLRVSPGLVAEALPPRLTAGYKRGPRALSCPSAASCPASSTHCYYPTRNALLTSQSVPVGVVPPLQPASVPALSYPVATRMPCPAPHVPVVGITPSQTVSNVFGAAGHPQAAHPPPSPRLVKRPTFPQPETGRLLPPLLSTSVVLVHLVLDDGRLASGDKHAEGPAGTCPMDPLEAQWAALESPVPAVY
ncbi:hypothetical protein GH733_016757 [Mirounga leonina]|nr:hypothetical protein GH733_016757 [Mirounga leonina]